MQSAMGGLQDQEIEMSIKIRQQCWDHAAEEMGSEITAEVAAKKLRARGHEVAVVDGDWGSSYTVDGDDPVLHAEVQNLQSELI